MSRLGRFRCLLKASMNRIKNARKVSQTSLDAPSTPHKRVALYRVHGDSSKSTVLYSTQEHKPIQSVEHKKCEIVQDLAHQGNRQIAKCYSTAQENNASVEPEKAENSKALQSECLQRIRRVHANAIQFILLVLGRRLRHISFRLYNMYLKCLPTPISVDISL